MTIPSWVQKPMKPFMDFGGVDIITGGAGIDTYKIDIRFLGEEFCPAP